MPTLACPSCGTSLPEDASFCLRCGTRMESSTVPIEPAPAAEDPAYRCICGTWNREGDAQCASCRRPLGQSPARNRPVQYVHTGPMQHPIIRPDPVRERMERDEEAGNTLGWVAVVCGVVSLLLFPVPMGLVAIACGIPAYLRGARHGLVGMFIGLLGILLIIWAYR